MKLKNKCLVSLSLLALSSISQGADFVHQDNIRANIGVDYNVLGNYVGSLKVDALFNDKNAASLELGFGVSEFRDNLTYGIKLTDNQSLKLTGEYLYQDKKFDFDYGESQRGVWQIASGLGYKYDMSNGCLDSVDASTYYVYSPGKKEKSGSVYFYGDEDYFEKYHNRVVGANIIHSQVGFTVLPWEGSSLKLGADYEYVKRDFHYSDKKVYKQYGFNANIEQVFLSWIKGYVSTNYLQQSQSYGSGLSFILPSPKGMSFELANDFSYEKDSISKNDSYAVKSKLSVSFGENKKSYKVVSEKQKFLDWVSKPVVRMSEVIADSETQIKKYVIDYAYSYVHPLSANSIINFSGNINDFDMNGWRTVSVSKNFDNKKAKFYGVKLYLDDNSPNKAYAIYIDQETNARLNLVYKDKASGNFEGNWNDSTPVDTNYGQLKMCQGNPLGCQFEVKSRV